MVTGRELKKGNVIEMDGTLYQVLDYQHIKMKRIALLRMKLRDVRGGHTIERTFPSNEKLKQVRLDYRDMQFLYADGNLYHFMDNETYEQIAIDKAQLGDALSYLKENDSARVSTYKDEVIGVELPAAVELEVVDTEPGFKGNTATGGTKPATVETGIIVQVPLFVEKGTVIKVDTRNGQYLERVGS
ncbi:MAG: elongation factor P [Dehalococcoidales bacterium]